MVVDESVVVLVSVVELAVVVVVVVVVVVDALVGAVVSVVSVMSVVSVLLEVPDVSTVVSEVLVDEVGDPARVDEVWGASVKRPLAVNSAATSFCTDVTNDITASGVPSAPS